MASCYVKTSLENLPCFVLCFSNDVPNLAEDPREYNSVPLETEGIASDREEDAEEEVSCWHILGKECVCI